MAKNKKITYSDMRRRGRCINLINGALCLGTIIVADEKIECCRCGLIVTKLEGEEYQSYSQMKTDDSW